MVSSNKWLTNKSSGSAVNMNHVVALLIKDEKERGKWVIIASLVNGCEVEVSEYDRGQDAKDAVETLTSALAGEDGTMQQIGIR